MDQDSEFAGDPSADEEFDFDFNRGLPDPDPDLDLDLDLDLEADAELDPDMYGDPLDSRPSFRDWGTAYSRPAVLTVQPAPVAVRFVDVHSISIKWFTHASVTAFGPGWWQAAQTRFLDHAEILPGAIWNTAHRHWLWFAWARTYPLPIMAETEAEFGMWRPSPACLSDYGRTAWSAADLEAYCTLWAHIWHRMRMVK